MGDRYLTDLADVLRAAGLTVVELDGWRDRARGSGGYDSGRPTHVMVHHTASPPSSSGEGDAWYCAEGDEDAPLSNLCLDRAGAWWVLAAGATNTNGAGGPLDNVPEDSMNTHAIGIEANGGYGESWPDVQTDAYVAGVRALCDHYGLEHVRAHFEWAPERKVDPAGPSPWASGSSSWNMGAFRADVESEADMPLSNADLDAIAQRVWAYRFGDATEDEDMPVWKRMRWIHGIARHYLGPWKDAWAPPEKTLLKQIDEQTQ